MRCRPAPLSGGPVMRKSPRSRRTRASRLKNVRPPRRNPGRRGGRNVSTPSSFRASRNESGGDVSQDTIRSIYKLRETVRRRGNHVRVVPLAFLHVRLACRSLCFSWETLRTVCAEETNCFASAIRLAQSSELVAFKNGGERHSVETLFPPSSLQNPQQWKSAKLALLYRLKAASRNAIWGANQTRLEFGL